MPARAPALIFDLGGVVVDWSPRFLFDRLLADPERLDYFLSEICPPEWNAEMDRGRSFAEAVQERCERFPEWAAFIEAYWRRWPEMLAGLIAGMERLVGELRAAGVPLYAITNWSAETFPLARERFSILRTFDGAIVVSGEVGLVKPDPAIYRLALRRFGLAPAECLFIDDSEPNVRAARRVGIPAIRFIDEPTLRSHPAVAAHLARTR